MAGWVAATPLSFTLSVFENENPGMRSHNSQNSGNGRPEGDCVNTVSAIGGFENENGEDAGLVAIIAGDCTGFFKWNE